MMISKKVILTGSFGVGKTSLFNRFLYSKFDEKYLTTIGVKVDKKVIEIDGHKLNMLIWDIAGEISQDKVPVSYFLGTSGLVYVTDLTRPITTKNLQSDLKYIREIAPGVTIKVIGNKADLLSEDELTAAKKIFNSEEEYDFMTSAKTGENVEELFRALGQDLIKNAVSKA